MTDDDDEPNLVVSPKSQSVLVDGVRFRIEIFRLETDPAWSLDVVDPENTSHVWEEQFASEKDALTAAIKAQGRRGLHARRQRDPVPAGMNTPC